ncbi:MAG: type II toxin-antitoxin system HicA family toxin [Spirochaetia bacterium]
MPMSGREMMKKYKENGWQVVRQRGSHVRMKKGDSFETIPLHKELKKGLEKVLLKRLEEVG